jgi:hypothetical protein
MHECESIIHETKVFMEAKAKEEEIYRAKVIESDGDFVNYLRRVKE